jgi:glucose-1-phosphate thymidylyltransferase
MQVVVYEDELVAQLAPVTLSRPAYTISCGSFRLAELLKPLGTVRCLVREYLWEIEKAYGRQILSSGLTEAGPTLLVNARLVPAVATIRVLRELLQAEREAIVVSGNRIAAALVKQSLNIAKNAAGGSDLESQIRALNLPVIPAELPLFEYPHDLIRYHTQFLRENLESRLTNGYRQLSDGLFVADGVTIGPHLVADARNGPILLDAEVSLGPFCYLSGPAYVGPGGRLIEHAVLKDGVTLGARAKVGGEIEASIIESLANKQHHGFLGHSYIGAWVNLGAGTSNSDLKNTYGTVNVEYGGRRVATGLQFVGCCVGDYSKTAVNTGIFTGKTIGVCSMVYGFVTTNVPSFTNYARSFGQLTESPADVAVAVQARMFARRGITQRPCDTQLLRDMFEMTRAERAQSGDLSSEPLSL